MLLHDRIKGVYGQLLTWLLLLTTQSMTAHLAYAQGDFYDAVNQANDYAKELRNQRSAPTFDANGNLTHNGQIILSTEELSGQRENSYVPADSNTYGNDAKTLMAGEDAQRTYDQKTLDTAETSGERAYHVTKSSFSRQKPDLSNDPLWSVTDDVFANLEEIAGDFANCEINTELVSSGRDIHVPKYETCNRLPAIEASFTIAHDYEVGVIKHKSGPVNLSPCGAGCLDVWIGTIGDNYWPGNCTIYEESMALEIIQPSAITSAVLARSKFDDYHQVWLNNTKVWNGPNELFPPETEGPCELKTSWDMTPNVDLLSYFTELTPLSDLNLKTRTSVSGNGEGYSAIRVHYDYNKLIYNDIWTNAEKITQAHEIKKQLDDGYCTGEIRCTDMPSLDADGCTTINGLRVCESNFGDNPMADLGISPFCRAVSVRSSCDFNSGEFCTTDMQGVEHCYDNSTENRNTCVEYEENPECSYVSTTCVEGAGGDSGNCYVQEDTYDCGFTVNDGVETEEEVLRCDGQLMCVGEGCYSPDRDEPNQDFAQVNAYMEMMKYAFADMTCEGIPDRSYDPNNPPEDYLPTPVCEDGYEYDPVAGECLRQLSCTYSENDFYASSPRNGIQILSNNAVIVDDKSILSCQPIKIGGITYTCGNAVNKIATDTFYEVCQNASTAVDPNGCPSPYHEVNQRTGNCEVPPILSCEEVDYTLEGQNTPFDGSDDVCNAPTMSVGYSCPTGYNYLNGTCSKTLTTSIKYRCSQGTLTGTQCKIVSNECRYDSANKVFNNVDAYCTGKTGGTNRNSGAYWNGANISSGYWTGAQTLTSSGTRNCGGSDGNSYNWSKSEQEICRSITEYRSATQYCDSGYTLSGSQCIKTVTSVPTKVCDSGYELTANGAYCIKQPPTMEVEYSCPPTYPNFSPEDMACKSQVTSPTDRFETPATPSCLVGYSFDSSSSMCVAESMLPISVCESGGTLQSGECQVAAETECRRDAQNHTNYTTSHVDGGNCYMADGLSFYRWDGGFVHTFPNANTTGNLPSIRVGNVVYSKRQNNAVVVGGTYCKWWANPGDFVEWQSEICRTTDPSSYPPTIRCESGYSLNADQTLCVKDGGAVEPTWSCPAFLPNFNNSTKMCSISATARVQTESDSISYTVAKEVLDTFLTPFEHMIGVLVPNATAEGEIPQTEEQKVTKESMQDYVGMQFVAAAVEAEAQKDMVAVGQQQVLSLAAPSPSPTPSMASYSDSPTPTPSLAEDYVPGENVSCQLFKGTASECKIAVGGIQDCCKNPTTVSLGDYISLLTKTIQFDALTGQVFGIEGYTGVWDVASNWTVDAATGAWNTVQGEFASAFDIALNESTGAATSGGAAGIGQSLMTYTNNYLTETFGGEIASMFFQTTGEGLVAWSAEMAAIGNAMMVVYYAYLAYVVFNLLVNIIYECEEEELDLAMKKDLFSTHYIGSYCKDDILGACIEKRRVYCAYDSPLSRIMMEQIYAQPQMGLDWGSPKNPNCTGLAIEQLENVDWDAVNLDEWVGILIRTDNYTDMVNIDVESLTGSGSNLNYEMGESRQNVIDRNLERASEIDADQVRRDAYEDGWDLNSQPIVE
ncbi:conjugal transfer protein TraN [Vibrio breoganii]